MIDRARLTELKNEMGEDDFDEVAEIFLEEMAETLDALIASTTAASPADFHALRGSASNLGFTGFAAACSEAEKRCQSGDDVDLVQLVALFRASVAAAADDLPLQAA